MRRRNAEIYDFICPRCDEQLEFAGAEGDEFICAECGMPFDVEREQVIYDPVEAKKIPPYEFLRKRIGKRSATYLQQIALKINQRAARLGLTAPYVLKTWDDWWAQTDPNRTPPTITLSRLLETTAGRRKVSNNHRPIVSNCTAGNTLAHEMGHAFFYYWKGKRAFAPLQGFRTFFDGRKKFKDPWNQLIKILIKNPNFTFDSNRFLNAYAWSDPEEDFAETFAEVTVREGRIEAFRHRPGVYRKMKFLLTAGRKILKADPVLRRCNAKKLHYLIGGEEPFECPEDGGKYGVPLVEGEYVCPCGARLIYDGETIYHTEKTV